MHDLLCRMHIEYNPARGKEGNQFVNYCQEHRAVQRQDLQMHGLCMVE